MRGFAVALALVAFTAGVAEAGVRVSIIDLDLDLPSTYTSDGYDSVHYAGSGGLNIGVDGFDVYDWSEDDPQVYSCADMMEDRPGLTAPPSGTPSEWRWYSREVSQYHQVSLMYCRDRNGSAIRLDTNLPDRFPEAEAQRVLGEMMRAIDRAIATKGYVPPSGQASPAPPAPAPPPAPAAELSNDARGDTTYYPPATNTYDAGYGGSYGTSYETTPPPATPKKRGFLGWPRLAVRVGQMDGLGDDNVPVLAGLDMTPLYIGREMERSKRGLVLGMGLRAGMVDGVFLGDYHMAVGYAIGRDPLTVGFAPALGIDRLGGGRIVTDGAFYYGAVAFARVLPTRSLALEARIMPIDRGGDLDELRIDLTAVTSAMLHGRVLALGLWREHWGDSVVVKGVSLGLSGTE